MTKKVCKHGLNDIWINEADGKVRMCGWSNFYIGKLTEQSIEEIWNGELANNFRESMLDGSYRYCNPSKCPYCANEQLSDMLVEYKIPEYPEFCSLSYQLQCNYVCKFCRHDYYEPCDCEKNNYEKIEREVKKMLPHIKTFSSNGAGEFFCSNSILNLIQNNQLNPDTNIYIETNGSLFTPQNWEKIKKMGDHRLKLSVTVHSFNERTYQYLSGTKLPITQIMGNLKFISDLRKANIVNEFEIATVICERNFREMPDFVKTCLEEFAMDEIRLRFFEPYGVMDLNTEWFYDVRNEYHPYHDEFVEIMKDPIFENEKVWKWQGETKSLQYESPYVLEKRNLMAMTTLIVNQKARQAIKEYLINTKVVALYGASNIGKAYREVLESIGIKVNTIFDTYAEEQKNANYEIIRPSAEYVNKYDVIIISTETYKTQIIEQLERYCYNGNVITITEILQKFCV